MQLGARPLCCWFLGFYSIQVANQVLADDDFFHANASLNEIKDTNFSRSPLNDEDDISLASAGVRFNETLGRQRFFANWQASRYSYAEHEDFNATVQSGGFGWHGQIGSEINTQLDWRREDHQVDRLEFLGPDVVKRQDATARVGVGNDNRLSFHIGAIDSSQTHSNPERSALEFDENLAFGDVGYETANKSSLYLRYVSGKREYRLDQENNDLDFDFQQLELESTWVMSPKTSLGAKVAAFKRDGQINSASGSVANLDLQWQATEKLLVQSGFSLNRPAIGETSDSPSEIKQVSASVQWQYSQKLSLGTDLRYSRLSYDKTAPFLEREETLYNASLLNVKFQIFQHMLLRFDAGLRKNESPIEIRNYTARQYTLGLVFSY